MKKKAISQHIATVLLVGFVIALITIVLLWGRNYIQEKAEKQGKLAEKQLECENIGFEVVNAYQQGNEVIVTLKNVRDKKIGKFTFRVIGEEIEPVNSFDELDGLSIRQYSLSYSQETIGDFQSISIVPWLNIVRGYYVPCSSKGIESGILLPQP